MRFGKDGTPYLWSFEFCGCISWLVCVVIALLAFAAIRPPTTLTHFGAAAMGMTLLHFWMILDAGRLCTRFTPDDYMKGVVYFYTDFLIMCCCCICIYLSE